MRSSLLEYAAFKAGDIRVRIEMIPGEVRKIDNVRVRQCALVRLKTHPWLYVLEVI